MPLQATFGMAGPSLATLLHLATTPHHVPLLSPIIYGIAIATSAVSFRQIKLRAPYCSLKAINSLKKGYSTVKLISVSNQDKADLASINK